MTIMTEAEFRKKHGPSPLGSGVLILPGRKPVPSEVAPPRAQLSEVEKGVQLLEERLGVEVDRDDPMLPAIGQMELALKRLMEKKARDQE
jgi:hypothetical protein